MGAEFSSKLSTDVLDVFFNGSAATTFDADANGNPGLFIALTSSQSAVDGTVSAEISGSGYARVAVTFGAATESTGTGAASVTNSAAVEFTGFSGTINSVDGFAVMSASTGGTALCYGSISSINIDSGDTVTFAQDAITISLD